MTNPTAPLLSAEELAAIEERDASDMRGGPSMWTGITTRDRHTLLAHVAAQAARVRELESQIESQTAENERQDREFEALGRLYEEIQAERDEALAEIERLKEEIDFHERNSW